MRTSSTGESLSTTRGTPFAFSHFGQLWALYIFRKWAGVIMGQTSRIVTIVDGVQVIEVTTHDPDGDPVETRYPVRGEKYETLKQAMEAAEWEAPPGQFNVYPFSLKSFTHVSTTSGS